jgi:proteasome accessory factor B
LLGTNKKSCSIGQLVRATGSSRATVYRDLALLRTSGYALQTETLNGEARYTLAASELTSRAMTPREHAAVALARRALTPVEGTWLVHELDSALHRAHHLTPEPSGVRLGPAIMTYNPSLLAVVHDAVTRQRVLRLRYRGAKDKTAQPRVVHPVGVQVVDQQPYLIAWDEQKKGMRTFKVARISQAKALRNKCRIPESALSPGSARAKAVKVWQSDPVSVRIRIGAPVARFVHEWPLVDSQQLQPAPKSALDVCAVVYGLEETLRWVLRWGKNAQVLEPPELRERVVAELRGALAAYGEERSASAAPGR